MRIGILTGGGDVPGLNPCIKALVCRAIDEGHEPIGIRRGWRGLLFYNPDDPAVCEECLQPLDKLIVRTIDRTGGTFLHTSRTNPSRAPIPVACVPRMRRTFCVLRWNWTIARRSTSPTTC
jgi:6-phosphofructokinase 1